MGKQCVCVIFFEGAFIMIRVVTTLEFGIHCFPKATAKCLFEKNMVIKDCLANSVTKDCLTWIVTKDCLA